LLKRECETGTGQQVAQLHVSLMAVVEIMMMDVFPRHFNIQNIRSLKADSVSTYIV
jgi:hypothetical protein